MWHFREMSRGEINEDPTAGDFFNVDALDNTADGLVRESIQNSLDAKVRTEAGPVKVRISLHGTSDNQSQVGAAREFLNGLWAHIEACDVIEARPAKDAPISWLAIEDFGTRGLVGDPATDDDPKPGDRNDFYYFWRNIGRGKKEGTERGRWGLGKTMFPAASRINSFFGLTRRDDGRSLLMGQSVLRIHRLNNKKHYPYGYYGTPDPTDEGFILPIDDATTVSAFSRTFGLARKNETGLSVVVPFYSKDALSAHDIKASVLRHYFFPVLAGELIVEVVEGNDRTTFEKMTLRNIASTLLDPQDKAFIGMLDLAEAFLADGRSKAVAAKEQLPNRSPEWSDAIFSGEQLDKLAERFDLGEILYVKVPVFINRKQSPVSSYFHLVFRRDPDLDRPMDVYIRQGITISGISTLREAGVRCLLIATDEPIAAFLGDAENPAHTEWQPRSRKFKGKYNTGPSTLAFIREAPRGLMRILNRRSESIDDTALRRVFPSLESQGKTGAMPTEPAIRDPLRTSPKKPVVPTSPPSFSLRRAADGFTLTLTEHGKKSLPLEMSARCAYDTGSGNPFKRWIDADFDFTKEGSVHLEGGQWRERSGNRLRVTATNDSFSLRASGFDSRRDLIVDARTEASNAQAI